MTTTYFGLTVVKDRLVRLNDIRRLPFFSFWEESSRGSALCEGDEGEMFVFLNDWENFSDLFIKTGKHRYSQ